IKYKSCCRHCSRCSCFIASFKSTSFLGDLMWIGISGVSAGTLGPIMYAIISKKKASPRAAEFSMIIGLTAYLIIIFTGIESSPLAAGGWATLIGIAAMWILAYTIKYEEQVNE